MKHLDERLTKEEATMLTKSTLVEAQELRDKIAMCALRHETRELVDAIRQEVSSSPERRLRGGMLQHN